MVITIRPPANGTVQFSSVNGGCNQVSGGGRPGATLTVTCQNIGSMAVGSPKQIRLIVGLLNPGNYAVNASLSGSNSDPNLGNNSRGLTTRVSLLDPTSDARVRTSFISEISGGTKGGVQAILEVNERRTTMNNSSPRQIAFSTVEEENVMAGVAQATSLEGVLWRFDFTNTEQFEPGSIGAELGEVLSMTSHTIVFRLAGTQGRVSFRFRIRM
jgi:hypothetical protein